MSKFFGLSLLLAGAANFAFAVAHPVLWTQHCSRCYRLEVLAPGLGR